MPVTAAVVTDLGMAACRVLATRDMPAERRRTTALDRTHHLQLAEAHMPAVGLTPAGTVVAEDIRDLEIWSSHGRRLWRRRLLLVSPRRSAARFAQGIEWALDPGEDRKSTRLNSSHGSISYAVFCLKKKKVQQRPLHPTPQQNTTYYT